MNVYEKKQARFFFLDSSNMPSWKINCLKSGDGIGLSTTIGKNKKNDWDWMLSKERY